MNRPMTCEDYGMKSMECTVGVEPRNITNDLRSIFYAVKEMEKLVDIITNKIDGTPDVQDGRPEKLETETNISDKLEMIKTKMEQVFNRLDRINSWI